MKLAISSVTFTPAPGLDQRDGLFGWVDIVIDDVLVIESASVRQSREGRMYLSFPEYTDRRGRKRHPVRPLDDAARIDIENQVIAELRRSGRLAA